MHVKTGQTVKVLSGKDKGKTGKIIQVFPELEKVVVEGVNLSYKHLKRRAVSGSEKGERVEYAAPIHASNVKLIEEIQKGEQQVEKTQDSAAPEHKKDKAKNEKAKK